ncbi:tetratricopeptide repeat protein, partial [Frankia sp. CIT1]|uniref:tetratricopeptide repeat protein n=1 Tax=Frankia sp. CIT1 TaxID=2880974 RepID=UPI001EF438D9
EEAIGLCEQVLTDRLRVLGPDHPDTLAARNNLAGTYGTAGRVEEAINRFEQVLTDLVRVLGPDHPLVATVRDNLAGTMKRRGSSDGFSGGGSHPGDREP